MRKAMSITLVLVLALSTSAFARPVDETGSLDHFQYLDMSGSAKDFVGTGNPGVFSAAQGGTTWFGGTVWAADSARWEAIEDEFWTFDTGVGSSIVGGSTVPGVDPYKLAGYHNQLNGWIGFDNTYSEITYFRRLSSADARWGAVCVGSAGGLQGSWSFWCGAFPEEADAICYAGGQGYGNSWVVCIEHDFNYNGSGGVTLGFAYKNDTEPDFDFTIVFVDSTGTGADEDVEATSFTGTVSGTASVPLTQGIELPGTAGPITIKFCFQSDGAWSDQDGLNPTPCGAFAVDQVTVSGGGIAHSTDFEANDGGWTLAPPAAGAGGEWANLYHLNELPAPLTPCTCALTDTVLAFPDDSNQHNEFTDNLAASPWIDLLAAGANGTPGKIIRTNLYAELPLLNYIFVQFNAQWYPEVCLNTGLLITAPWTSNGFVYYFGGVPQCTTPDNLLGTQIDFSAIVPSGAEQVRIALGVLSYCRFFANCTGSSNTTPWFDKVALGVYGAPGAPYIFSDTIDIPQDNFPENGTLGVSAPGRVECNNIQGDSQPEVGTTLGDTLIVQGGVGNAEVYVHFRVTPGPGTNATAFNTWNNSHANSAVEAGFKVARMDTSERGESGPIGGNWMTAYHEADPNFSGTDRDIDGGDIAPNGGAWRLANDIFPDDLFPMGTRIDIFYTANNVGSGVIYKTPVGVGVYHEMEILPSSADAGLPAEWNCVLYVDHFNRGAQVYVEDALTNILGVGSENFEGTNWDRFDVNAESSQQMSVGRPLQTEYGASVIQFLAYKAILWNTGNLNAFNLTKEDADGLNPWLTLLDFDFNNLYLTGDGIVFSPLFESESEPSARRLIEDLAGVTVKAACANGNYRASNCPTAGAPEDLTACVNLDPVLGAVVAGGGRAVDHTAQGNGCPQLRAFDVLDVLTPDFGTALGDERFSSVVKTADYASVSTDAASSGILNYKIVTDGVSVHYRRDEGTPCDFATGGSASVEERLDEVLSYFGYAAAELCADPSAGTGLGDVAGRQEPKFRTSLFDFAPNPLVTGAAGRIQFAMEKEGRATIDVYDIEGRLVKTVFDGIAQEGTNDAFWNGTNEAGTQVASGVYFYRLRAGIEDLSKKMVVVRNGGN